MRVLVVHNYYQFRGGEETYVDSLVKLLKENGHTVYLYSKDSRNAYGVVEKIKIILNLIFGYETKREFKEILASFKPDIVHFNNIYPLIGQTAYETCSKFSVPIVQTVHSYRPMCINGHLFRKNKICELCVKSSSINGIMHKCFQNSYFASFFFSLHLSMHRYLYKTHNKVDAFIFPSEFTKEYFEKNLHIHKSKTHLLPYYISKIDTQKKETTNHKNKNYFLFFGRLSEEKGVEEIIKVFIKMQKMKLIVVGDGPQADHLKKITCNYNNIQFLGKKTKSDLYQIIKNSRCVIINSLWYEVLPFVILETITNGKPILVHNNKNIGNFIVNKNCLFSTYKELQTKMSEIVRKEQSGKYIEKYAVALTPYYHFINLMRIYSLVSLSRTK